MSGLDPLAAFALQAVANAQAALEESTLNLGSLISDFQAQISVGDILNATVLPPQNGSDRISLLGQTIAAQLPPGIDPGETIALQVTGFTNSAIIVRNLGTVEPEAPPAAPASEAVPAPPPRPVRPPVVTPPPRPISPPPASTPPARVAPPRELFVAASVRPTQAQQSQPAPSAEAAPVSPPENELEARIVATRASTTIGSPPAAKTLPATPNATAARAIPAAPQAAAAHAAVTRASVERALVASQVRANLPSAAQPAPAAPQTPEAALLARLRVPQLPATLAAARIVETATRSVTTAFERLDALLEKSPPDPRTATLRSSLAFVAKFDLRNARALPEQIASYVSNVVTGAESKIAQIVRAWSEAVAQEATTTPQPLTDETPEQQAALPSRVSTLDVLPSPPQAARAPGEAQPVLAARAVERSVALDHDLKASLVQLVANPPQGSSAQLVAALRDALTATTAVQLNVLSNQNANPNAITIPLPAYFYEGGQPAHLQISRDAPNGKNAMDADNFHITFVLDTKTLGTVAIDVQTAGRAVNVDVKTESSRSADRFRSSLADLRSRIEGLHYRVSSMAAGMAARAVERAPMPQPAPEPRISSSNVDMQA